MQPHMDARAAIRSFVPPSLARTGAGATWTNWRLDSRRSRGWGSRRRHRDAKRCLAALQQRAYLVCVGDRGSAAVVVCVTLVVAHPPQRRRVDMDRSRRATPRVPHAMDVRGVEVERRSGLVLSRRLAQNVAVELEPVLRESSLADVDGARGDVVIEVTRVLRDEPADQPDVDVGVE